MSCDPVDVIINIYDVMHTVTTAEKVSSLGKDWHKLCLKCAKCNKSLSAGGHAEVGGVD